MRNLLFREIRLGLSLLLLALFVVEPLAAEPLTADAGSKKVLTGDQRVRQVLARLSFGARAEDFGRVREMGLRAYVDEQLNPDAIDDAALDKRLEKLPTLTLSTPALAEQYNPPKPKAAPAPTPDVSQASMPTASPTPSPAPSPAAVISTDAATPKAGAEKPGQREAPQSAAPPAAIPPAAAQKPAPKPTPAPKNPQMVVTELQRAKLLRAVYSERQLYEVMVDFWENHFSIYANKDADRWMMTAFDRDAVRPFAFGRFRDLLGATARSPAMLYYLDNWQSGVVRKYPATKDKPARQSGGINENYARELMELHTLGVDGGYAQKDVQEVARCFTGWTIRKPNEEGLFFFNPQMHDNGEKTVLGRRIAAGGGVGDAEKVLDILATSPATAHFIAAKLARRFLGDSPPEAVVRQAAQTFLKTDGSIRETLRAVITSPAFLTPAAYQTKIKSPFEFAVAALRITGAETDAGRPVLDWISKMGQPLFGHLTPEGYTEKSGEWVSTGSLLTRLNFATALAQNKIKGTKIDAKMILRDADLGDPAEVSARLMRTLLRDEVSPRSKTAFDKIAGAAAAKLSAGGASAEQTANAAADAKAAPPPTAGDNRAGYVAELITLMLGSPEFQRK